MIHLAIITLHLAIIVGLSLSLLRFAAALWRTSDVVALPVICEEPARTHVENGELTFFFSYTPAEARATMPRPSEVQ
jgi:hypothetical protein